MMTTTVICQQMCLLLSPFFWQEALAATALKDFISRNHKSSPLSEILRGVFDTNSALGNEINIPSLGPRNRDETYSADYGSSMLYSGDYGSGLPYSGDYRSGLPYNRDYGSGLPYSGDYGSGLPYSGDYGSGMPYSGDYGSGMAYSGDYGSGMPNSGDYGSGMPYGGDYGSGMPYSFIFHLPVWLMDIINRKRQG
ncbi:antigen [Plakobranchus ocellatus]|uniref:Antigen n=1 Tax=Plakobranchus ocellatus TaxID=259542 RepID=A0AAV3Z151_9GAST|nr:antigen [Plakobranchus ocellatus]